eukprot:5910355-Ditylum_brightwellii.AAC.1
MEAILPRIMPPGRRKRRKGRKYPTLTPTGVERPGTGTLQLLLSPSLKMRIVPQRRRRRRMPLLDSLLFLVATGTDKHTRSWKH